MRVVLLSLKVLCRIKLPYLIKIQDIKEYSLKLPECEHFSDFKIIFLPNIKESNYFYNPEYGDDVCDNIEIQTIAKVPNLKTSENQLLTLEDRIIILDKIRKKVNEILRYLQYKTKMFWIKELKIDPLSGLIGMRTEFLFLHANQETNENMSWTCLINNSMSDIDQDNIKPVNDEMLKSFCNTYLVKPIWKDYFNKAHQSIYECQYENFIIYSAICAESFIKSTIHSYIDLDTNKDIVLKKFIEIGKKNMVEVYYKYILKYLFGKNLLEIDESLYSNLVLIFKLRNELMHTGYIDENTLRKVGTESLNFDVCSTILLRLDKTIMNVLSLIMSSNRD